MATVMVNGKKKKIPDPWKGVVVGEKGTGKSYSSLYEIYEKIKVDSNKQQKTRNGLSNGESLKSRISSNPPITGWVSSSSWGQPSRTDGNSGAPFTSQPYTNQPYTSQPYRTSDGSTIQPNTPFTWPEQQPPYGTGTTIPQQQQVWPYTTQPQSQPGWNIANKPQEQKHTTEDLKGKLVAFATITIDGVEHKGILFVRKCGAWKLIECETMKKIASGGKDEKLPEVVVHYVIYSQFDDDNKKKKKGRFDDLDMKEPREKQ